MVTIGDRNAVLWECERRRELRCPVYVTTDEEGVIVKDVVVPHIHDPPAPGRTATLAVRHTLMQEAMRRPEASPVSLLNDYVTPVVASYLGGERTLKRSIQRKRKAILPIDPTTATNIVVADAWRVTLEGKEWYLGDFIVGHDSGYIFATEDNLQKLKVGYI